MNAELFQGENFQMQRAKRIDRRLHGIWGRDAPDPSVGRDHVSIRWTGWIKAPRPGWYKLTLLSDDGARLWLDDKLLIDRWKLGALAPSEAEFEFDENPHALRIEFFEQVGEAGRPAHTPAATMTLNGNHPPDPAYVRISYGPSSKQCLEMVARQPSLIWSGS